MAKNISDVLEKAHNCISPCSFQGKRNGRYSLVAAMTGAFSTRPFSMSASLFLRDFWYTLALKLVYYLQLVLTVLSRRTRIDLLPANGSTIDVFGIRTIARMDTIPNGHDPE